MGRARQALDGLGLSDLTLFNRTEPGEEFVHLHLLDVEVAQVIARKRFQVIRRLDQPAQHRIGIRLKHPGYSANAKSLGQSRNGSHQIVGVNRLAVKRRVGRLQEIAVAA